MQQTCQSSDHYQNEHDYKHQEEMLEEIFYDPQAEEKIVHFCNFLQQLTPKNDDNNEENSIVCWNDSEKQLDSLSNSKLDSTSKGSCVVENQLSKEIECYDDYQTNHVFFDPIADYMEKIYCSGFQLYVHLEEQLHLMLPWLFQYLVYLCFKHSKEIQVSDQIDDWLHWKFHVP